MVLDFEYGINTGNRFLDFVDHDEDPEEFIAGQAKAEEKQKKSTKDSKPVTSTSSKKPTSKTSTTATTTSVSNAGSATARTNKENLTGKSINVEQRKQQSVAFSDNNNQQTRVDSGRGGGRGFQRRGGSAGQDRPPYEGGNRGGSQPRPQRFNKFQGQQGTNETTGFEQGADAWTNETGNDNQSFGGYRGRGRGGRGRGNYEGGRGGSSFEGGRGGGNFEGGRGGSHYEGGRGGGHYEGGRGGGHYEGGRGGGHYEGGRGGGHYEGGRGGGGRGRGRGGRGYYNNRNFGEGSQQQQTQEQESAGGWEQNAASNFNNAHPQSVRAAGQDIDTEVSPQEQPFESDGVQRGGRGHFRARTFRNNRQYGGDRPNYYEREGGGQDDYRHNRRQHDRQPRTNLSGVKPIEKKDGEGAHNWGSPTENPDENVIADENAETAAATDAAGPSTKDWSQLVDEAEKQMTLDEYRKQSEAKKKINQEKLPQFNRRTAGEGEDPSVWKEPEEVYRKKNDGDDEEEEETESGAEECGSGEEEEVEEEQTSGKKKIISIPLQFNPIEGPRGPTGSFGLRGGPRRGGSGGRFRERPARNDQPRSNSPTQQQPFSSQQTGDHSNDERPQTSYRGVPRGGPRPGFVRGESRRPYGNSARGSRGGYNRSGADPNAPDLDNAFEFPTLAK